MTVRIHDALGAVVRELAGEDMHDAGVAGINRVYWDLRHQPLARPQALPAGGGGGAGAASLTGPFVLPGDYRVTLVVDRREAATRTLRVAGDPAMAISDADRKLLHETALGLHEMLGLANRAADAVAR